MTSPVQSNELPVRALIPGWSLWDTVAPNASQHDGRDPQQGASRSNEEFRAFLLASLQMQNLLVLAGSGTSLSAGGPTMSDLWTACINADTAAADAVFTTAQYGRAPGENSIEELLSRCDALLQFTHNAAINAFRVQSIAKLLSLCRVPGTAVPDSLGAHREFLKRLARRRARDTRLKIFTTNYDRCFELAAGELGLVAIDGFSFSQPRRFDPRFFDYDIVSRAAGNQDTSAYIPGVFQYYKLHGSVDWRLTGGSVVIDANVSTEDAALIYPASTKFKTSYQQPHLELMAQYLASLRQANTCLVVAGFGFNDRHLSEPILAALETNPHLRVIVVSPNAEQKMQATPIHDIWGRLTVLAHRGADVAFVGARFDDFVPLIPDLRALSPAERLARAVEGVVD